MVTPPEARAWYSESLVLLPGTYQVTSLACVVTSIRSRPVRLFTCIFQGLNHIVSICVLHYDNTCLYHTCTYAHIFEWQVNDCRGSFAAARADAEARRAGTRRGDAGLPEGDVLIGNFNQAREAYSVYITEGTWRAD